MILGIANFLWLSLSVVLAGTTTITNNIYTSVLSYNCEVSIATGVTMKVDNARSSRANIFNGLVVNNGEMYIGDSENNHGGMWVKFYGGLINKGTMIFNAINETSGTCYETFGKVFQNDGTMVMIARGDRGGSIIRVLPEKPAVAVNNGILAWYQTTRNDGNGYTFGREALTVENNGTICLYQVGLYQWSKVNGKGCWSVGHNSVLFMNQPKYYYLTTGQLVYLETPYSHLFFNYQTPPSPITVHGWGNGNTIGFKARPKYSYMGDKLTVTVGSTSYELVIGQGYDPNAFIVKYCVNVGNAYNIPYALTYYGEPAAKSRPPACAKCPDINWMAFS